MATFEVPSTARSRTQGKFICPLGNYYEVTIRWNRYTLYGAPFCPCGKGVPHRLTFLE